MGNPHCVIFVEASTTFPWPASARRIEHHPLFPSRINVEFVQVLSRDEVRQRTWERGAGETLACGTGASAVTVAGVLTGRTERKISTTCPAATWNWNGRGRPGADDRPGGRGFSGEYRPQ